MSINGKTTLYGIIGNPVGHSLSPAMQNAAFAASGLNSVYVPMQITDLRRGIDGLRSLGFKGVSVTIPHKESVLHMIEKVDPTAARIGAVNTLLFERSGFGEQSIIKGYNTDWLGATQAISQHLQLAGSTLLVIGAGGAAKAVGYGLVQAGAEVIITNRTVDSGKRLADWLGCDFVSLDQVSSVEADAVINTTSVGMQPDIDKSVMDAALLHRYKVVMDIVYAPLETRLLREAAAAGCKVVDGLAMLLLQGAAQFKIWTGLNAPLEVMREALINELNSRK